MPQDITIRKAEPTDHAEVIAALQNWWCGRDVTAMLPKLFLNLPNFCALTKIAI